MRWNRSGAPRVGARPRRLACALAVVPLIVLAGCGGSPAESADKTSGESVSFADKTIRIIVPFGPGGGTDVAARLISKLMSSHLEGKPTIIVENLPGAGGALGVNAMMREPADGTTIAMVTPGISLRWLTKSEGHDYPLTEMKPIGATSSTVVTVARTDVAETPRALIDRGEKFVTGHESADGTQPLIEKVSANLLNLEVDQKFGFEGYGEVALAVERKELDGSTFDANTFTTNFADLDVVPLMQMGQTDGKGGVERNAAFADVPTVLEVYQDLNGSAPTGENVDIYNALVQLNSSQFAAMVKPETPDAIVEALTAAFAEMVASPEWDAQTTEAFGDAPGILDAAAVSSVVESLDDFSPAVVSFIKESQQAR